VTLDSNIEFIDTIFTQKVDDEIVLFDSKSEYYYGLDSIGAIMWESMIECSDLHLVHQKLLDRFDVDSQRLETDLLHFIEKLIENGLLREKY